MLEGGAKIASLGGKSWHNMEQTLGFKKHAEMTILVVDDDPTILSFVSGFLNGRYNVLIAKSGMTSIATSSIARLVHASRNSLEFVNRALWSTACPAKCRIWRYNARFLCPTRRRGES